MERLRTDKVGQQVLYNTGPRPHPYAIMKALAPQGMWPKLGASVLVDFIGCTSYGESAQSSTLQQSKHCSPFVLLIP